MTSSTLCGLGATITLLVVAGSSGEAHKPILSPYTFTTDVRPILEARCARCHTPGGAAPMSLRTYEDTVPWGESIRLEVIAGHMPPWTVANASMFRDLDTMTGREMNVLLTWAAGGTPRGDPAGSVSDGTEPDAPWRLGTPDLLLEPDTEFALGPDAESHTAQFTLHAGTDVARWLRAVDVRPGTPSIVRRATVEVAIGTRPQDVPLPDQRVLALWQPGVAAAELDAGAGFRLPAGATLTLRVDYRRNWQHERVAITDRTQVGLYFAGEPAATIRSFTLQREREQPGPDGELLFVRTVPDDLRIVSLYPDSASGDVQLTLAAVTDDGSRRVLLDSLLRAGWARRYTYREPVSLRAGTQLEVRMRPEAAALLPPGLAAPTSSRIDDIRITMDAIPGIGSR